MSGWFFLVVGDARGGYSCTQGALFGTNLDVWLRFVGLDGGEGWSYPPLFRRRRRVRIFSVKNVSLEIVLKGCALRNPPN